MTSNRAQPRSVKKNLENEFFSRSGNFNFSQGNLEKVVKVREK